MKNSLLLALLLLSLCDTAQGFHSRPEPIRKRTRNATPGSANPNTPLRQTAKFKNLEEVFTSYQEEPLMVIFTAVNCGPCRLMKKELKQVKDQVSLKMFAIDTEQYPHVGTRFQIAALPCLLVVRNGEPILRIEGVQKAEQVVEQIHSIALL
jgi:thioredoxin-like negative regulator of GroEL